MKNNILWCDMDGVLAHAPKEHFLGDNPKYLIPGEHFFRDCQPDTKMIEVLARISHFIPVFVLSNIGTDDISTEHKVDKMLWVQRYLPKTVFFDTTIIPKNEYVKKALHRDITHDDILISDYNGDLTPWTKDGGAGIKYLNGKNTATSYSGLKINEDMSTDEIVDMIIKLRKER